MDCLAYTKLMSLKLDGALDAESDRVVDEHIATCASCAALWDAMLEADVLMWKWVREPLPVPNNFGTKVMLKLAAQADVERAPSYVWTPQTANVTRPLGDLPAYIPGPLTTQMQGWQRGASRYVRVAAIVGLSMAVALGLLMSLLVTGVLQFDGPLAGLTTTLRTYLSASDTWVRSLFMGMGAAVYAVAGIVMLLLALAGWQLVVQYQRGAAQARGNTGYLVS